MHPCLYPSSKNTFFRRLWARKRLFFNWGSNKTSSKTRCFSSCKIKYSFREDENNFVKLEAWQWQWQWQWMTMTMKDIYCQSCTKKIRQSYMYTIRIFLWISYVSLRLMSDQMKCRMKTGRYKQYFYHVSKFRRLMLEIWPHFLDFANLCLSMKKWYPFLSRKWFNVRFGRE